MNARILLQIVPLSGLLLTHAFGATVSGDELVIESNPAAPTNTTGGTTHGIIGDGNTIIDGSVSLTVGSENDHYLTESSLLVGNANFTDGFYQSLAVGTNNAVYAYGGLLIGNYHDIAISEGIVAGYHHTGQASLGLIAGRRNSSTGGLNFLLGEGLQWTDTEEAWELKTTVVLGDHNLPAIDGLLVIGNGYPLDEYFTSVIRHNALELNRAGRLSLYGTTATTPPIVLDPDLARITINGHAVLTATSLGALSSSSYAFGNGATNYMTINTSGHVGINKSTPSARLDVSGNVALGVGVSSASDQVVVGRYNDTRTNNAGTDHTQGVFIVGAGNSSTASNAIRVLADGTVLMKRSGDLSMGTFTSGQQP